MSIDLNTVRMQWPGLRAACVALAMAWATLVATSSAVWAQDESVDVERRRTKLALLPMVVHSNERADYLRQGLSDMLTARFTKENVIDVIAVDDEHKATTDLDKALETARDLGADYVVFGSFTRFGQGASLDVQTAAIADGPDGDTLREIFVHSGSIGEVIPDLDDLVGKVTRFAIGEYEPVGIGPGSSAAEGGPSRADLIRRIEALEAQMQSVQGTAAPN